MWRSYPVGHPHFLFAVQTLPVHCLNLVSHSVMLLLCSVYSCPLHGYPVSFSSSDIIISYFSQKPKFSLPLLSMGKKKIRISYCRSRFPQSNPAYAFFSLYTLYHGLSVASKHMLFKYIFRTIFRGNCFMEQK